MAKKYIITEAQYKVILETLSLDEPDMVGEPEGDDVPDTTLTDVTLDAEANSLIFTWEEDGTGTLYKSALDITAVEGAGFDPIQIEAQFKSTGAVPEILDDLAWDNDGNGPSTI